jgi:diguanylate cyclase (GGDEF)-like protein/PAS domain S-box-containing protein
VSRRGRSPRAPLTLRQRLGLARTDLTGAERRQLAIGRAGAALFAWEATFVLAAALAQGGLLGAQAPVLLAVGWAYAIGALVLFAYHRIGPAGMHVLAAAGGAIVTTLVLTARDGDLYGWLYILPVFFVSFFLSRTSAALHVGAMIGSFGVATAIADPLRDALHAWILGTGALVGAAVLVVVLRARLHRVVASRTAALERERESRSLLDAFFRNAPAALSFLDCDLRYIRVNDAFCAACGVEGAVGRTVREVWPPELAEEMEPVLRHVLETGEAVVGEELSGEAPPGSGQIRHWLVSRYPVAAPDGEIVGVASIAVDATRQKESEARLEELLAFEQSVRLEIEVSRQDLAVQASTDPLTGLANRAAVTHDLELALARAERSSLVVGVLYLDLDGFKGVNDTLGHAAGDVLLRTVAARLRAVARKTDVVARLGGDEFLVLLADLPGGPAAAEVVRSVAARIVDEVNEPVAVAGDEARVSASVGISLYPWDAADAAALIANADAAMYAGKRSGRGLVRFFGDTSEAA